MVCNQNLMFWISKHIVTLMCSNVFLCSYYATSLLRFLLVLNFLCFVSE